MSDMIERPTDAADPTYPDAERCAQTLENCEDDLLTEAQFVRWQGQEIERLTAALRAQPGPVSMDDMEWAGKVHLAEAIRERDDHARWRADLADKLHDRETTISAAWEALRSAGVHSEATIDDGIRLLRRQLAEAELKREPLSDERITKGEYVLATKWSDGDPGDHWGVGFYDRFENGRHYVVDSAGQQIRGNGFRRVGRITADVGRWLLSAAKSLEASPPGTVNLWTMLTERAHGIGGSDE